MAVHRRSHDVEPPRDRGADELRHITELHYPITLRDYVTEIYYGITLWNHITE